VFQTTWLRQGGNAAYHCPKEPSRQSAFRQQQPVVALARFASRPPIFTSRCCKLLSDQLSALFQRQHARTGFANSVCHQPIAALDASLESKMRIKRPRPAGNAQGQQSTANAPYSGGEFLSRNPHGTSNRPQLEADLLIHRALRIVSRDRS
jgi:hypothetical protein